MSPEAIGAKSCIKSGILKARTGQPNVKAHAERMKMMNDASRKPNAAAPKVKNASMKE